MYTSRDGEVCLDGKTAAQVALDTSVELVALRNSQRRIEPSRKVRIQHTKLTHQSRVSAQLLWKAKIVCHERTTLIGAQLICIEEELLLAECEIIDRAQQWPIEEDAAAESQS